MRFIALGSVLTSGDIVFGLNGFGDNEGPRGLRIAITDFLKASVIISVNRLWFLLLCRVSRTSIVPIMKVILVWLVALFWRDCRRLFVLRSSTLVSIQCTSVDYFFAIHF
jgi:hypothetical protein